MQTLRVFAALVIVPTLTSLSFGQPAPEGFRDLKWGATPEEVRLAFPSASCDTKQSELSDWMCELHGEQINDVSVFILLKGYTSGKVVGMSGISLSFRSNEVDRIAEAFEDRYGKPSRVEEKEFRTRAGERFPNMEWQWEFPDSKITIMQHGATLGSAHALVSLRAATDEFKKRIQQRKSGAGKGL